MTENVTERIFAHIRAFEWDENKRNANVVKHGIDFVDAIDVFADPIRFTYHSTRQSGEGRYVSIGKSKGKLITVVSTVREETLRIISARAARRNEREIYEKERKEGR